MAEMRNGTASLHIPHYNHIRDVSWNQVTWLLLWLFWKEWAGMRIPENLKVDSSKTCLIILILYPKICCPRYANLIAFTWFTLDLCSEGRLIIGARLLASSRRMSDPFPTAARPLALLEIQRRVNGSWHPIVILLPSSTLIHFRALTSISHSRYTR
jgi:hypothetical protein